jgi:hypothetical protein
MYSDSLRLPKSLRSIVRMGSNSDAGSPEVLYVSEKKKKKKKKRQTVGLGLIGKWARRYNLAVGKLGDDYVERHERSNRKKRDGWLRDYGYNMLRANRVAMKKLRLPAPLVRLF